MAPQLTRTGSNGVLKHPPEVEVEIDSLLILPTSEIRARLLVSQGQPGWISNEALTRLARDARQRIDRLRLDCVVPAWIKRCERWLARENEDVVDEALRLLADWLAADSDRLDFFEVRFRRALRLVRIHARRTVRRARPRFEPLDEATDTEDPATNPLTIQIRERAEQARAAIERLEDPVRQAAILVWIMELKQAEAARLMGVTDRTIRHYLHAARTQVRATTTMEES